MKFRPIHDRDLIEVLDILETLTPYSKKDIADASYINACNIFNL